MEPILVLGLREFAAAAGPWKIVRALHARPLGRTCLLLLSVLAFLGWLTCIRGVTALDLSIAFLVAGTVGPAVFHAGHRARAATSAIPPRAHGPRRKP